MVYFSIFGRVSIQDCKFVRFVAVSNIRCTMWNKYFHFMFTFNFFIKRWDEIGNQRKIFRTARQFWSKKI